MVFCNKDFKDELCLGNIIRSGWLIRCDRCNGVMGITEFDFLLHFQNHDELVLERKMRFENSLSSMYV